ncbi:Uncharacterised protein [Streptococcus dysgalactiae subsp. equisimilis]|nr:Uncharacterised protein [Streptococcus dysgalactiae subsp. equisimilis]
MECDSDIKVINADLTNHDYSNYSIDVIFSNGVMEHFSDSEIIDTLNKQLVSNAYIIVSIPTDFLSQRWHIMVMKGFFLQMNG